MQRLRAGRTPRARARAHAVAVPSWAAPSAQVSSGAQGVGHCPGVSHTVWQQTSQYTDDAPQHQGGSLAFEHEKTCRSSMQLREMRGAAAARRRSC